jgi:regulator of telomere elongation helicase 1
MGKVLDALLRSENALLESPTGTGKTLCLLCAALAWQREQARAVQSQDFGGASTTTTTTGDSKNKANRVPTIIYASRTHSQLSQVVRELRNTRYRPKHAVLGSREQMCVNPKVKKANATGTEINHDCGKLCKERKCRFKNKLEGFEAPSNESSGSAAFGTQPVRDMEDLIEMGNTHKVCPFYYTRSLVQDAELILVPYNYLFDKDSRGSTLADVPWDNAVLIFDEAHNLESFASESASFDLTSTDIAGCLGEIQRAVGYLQTFGRNEASPKEENILKLKSIFLKFEEYVMNMDIKSAYRGEFMMEIFQKGATITHDNHELFITEIRRLTDVFMEHGGSSSRGAPKLDHFLQCVKRVFGEPTEARCLAKAQSYRVHVTPKTNGNAGRTVSYWCFAPSEAMRELANLNVRSILVTSGTLSPLESYALELDLPFPNRLENPHIIPPDQMHVRVLGKGVSGKLLTSSYERRQDADYYTELGNTLVSLGKVIPGGMLVFFPSYSVMESCLERWGGPVSSRPSFQKGKKPTSSFFAAQKRKSTESARYSFPYASTAYSATKETPTPWKRLLGTKAVVVEPRSTADLSDAIAEFHKFLNLPKSKGVVLFGVCRGKISEGIDFAHDMCRAVIITGLPFAPSFDPKVKMKREFLDQNRATQNIKASTNGGFGVKRSANVSLSGHEWYTQQAHRAVNQALGRVIRNKDDYGAILLLDSRFSLPGNQQGLSKWVRPHIQPDEGVGRAIGGLVKFYRDNEREAQRREKEVPPPQAPNEVSIILKYEEEEGNENQISSAYEEEFTNIAIIESKTLKGTTPTSKQPKDDGTRGSPSRNYVNPDRIIARVNMKTKEGSQNASTVMETQNMVRRKEPPLQSAQQMDATAVGLSASISSQSSQSVAGRSSDRESTVTVQLSTPANTSRGKKAGGSPSQTAAMHFFQKVQSLMSAPEQSSIKKAVVAMKQFTDQKHRKAFLKAAVEIVKIILLHEGFENRSKDDKPPLLALLFQLLPKHFVHDVQKWTMYMALNESAFGKMTMETLDSKDCRNCQKDTAGLLWEIWFDDDAIVSLTSFLPKLQKIIALVLKSNEKSTPGSFGCFLKLIPLEYHSSTTGFIDQLKASQNISRIKAMEKSACGEQSVQTERFRKVPVKQESLDTKPSNGNPAASSKPTDVNQTTKSERGTNLATGSTKDDPDRMKKRPNPYSRKPVDDKQSRTTGVNNASSSRPVKGRRGLSLGSLLNNNQNADPVKRLLHNSESDTFTGKVAMNVANSMKSNAPKNMTCTICERASEKVRQTAEAALGIP